MFGLRLSFADCLPLSWQDLAFVKIQTSCNFSLIIYGIIYIGSVLQEIDGIWIFIGIAANFSSKPPHLRACLSIFTIGSCAKEIK